MAIIQSLRISCAVLAVIALFGQIHGEETNLSPAEAYENPLAEESLSNSTSDGTGRSKRNAAASSNSVEGT
jgi:hypothetical protein